MIKVSKIDKIKKFVIIYIGNIERNMRMVNQLKVSVNIGAEVGMTVLSVMDYFNALFWNSDINIPFTISKITFEKNEE